MRREAAACHVDPARLVLAPITNYPDHLARQKLADLFLDAWPYNGGTTASDALWAGLPVLMFAGRSYAARMAGSLLQAVGLPELVTHSPEAYAALALRLETDAELLGDYAGSWPPTRPRCSIPIASAGISRRPTGRCGIGTCGGEPPATFTVESLA